MVETSEVPVLVLGGSGYVSGELLRLLAIHPRFRVAAVASSSHAGDLLDAHFPHLAGTAMAGIRFASLDEVLGKVQPGSRLGVFSALPHGASAEVIDRLLRRAEQVSAQVRVVDLSADFRFADAAVYEKVYGHAHAAAQRCASFLCALPELSAGVPAGHVAHPGCFTTAVVLAAYPVLALGLCDSDIFAAAVTGSSGSGRVPVAGTHHPERHGNLYAYAPLAHRHEAEMRQLLASALNGSAPHVDFVPHSGPFVRGIHATLRMTLKAPLAASDAAAAINRFYESSSFVHAQAVPARLTEVIATNRCCLGVAARGRTLVLTSVIDNLVKGAAGGAVQWMNRLSGLSDEAGLNLPGLGVF